MLLCVGVNHGSNQTAFEVKLKILSISVLTSYDSSITRFILLRSIRVSPKLESYQYCTYYDCMALNNKFDTHSTMSI